MNTTFTQARRSIRHLGLLAATTTLLGLSALSTPALAGAYPEFFVQQVAAPSTVTRAQVQADLLQARRSGALIDGDSHFQTQVAANTGMGKTRAQVMAETLEAIRLGLIPSGEQNIFPTTEQLEQVRLAGLRALPMNVAQR